MTLFECTYKQITCSLFYSHIDKKLDRLCCKNIVHRPFFLHKDPMLRKYITAKYMQTKQERLPSKLHGYFIYKHSFTIRQATS